MFKRLMFVMSILGPAAIAVQPVAPQSTQITLTKDNTLAINDVFYGETVAQIIKQAKDLDARVQSTDPIYLVISSPGGSIEAGLELIENLSSLKRPVHTITIFSASMGFQTVQGLGDRLILKNGTLMSHRAQGFFYGEFPGQLNTRLAHYTKRVTRMDELAVKRSNGKLTLESYHKLIEPEYWADGQDAVELGLADKVVTATCDKSLVGTTVVPVIQLVMSGHAVELKAEYDNCPLNTNALKYTIFVDGEPFFKDTAPTQAPKANAKDDSFLSYLYGSSSIGKSDGPRLTKEETFEIQQRMNEIIQKKTNREVVRGY